MGLIRLWYQVSTTEPALRSQLRTGGLEINTFPWRIPQPRSPDTRVTMQVSTVDRCHRSQSSFPFSVAPQLRENTYGSPKARSEQFDRSNPDPHSYDEDSTIRDWEEHEDRGSGAQRSSETARERTSGGVRDTAQSGKSEGKSPHSGYTMVCIDRYCQSRREAGLTGFLGVPWLWSTSRRDQPKHLVLSKPSWNPSPFSIPNIRFLFQSVQVLL